MARVESDMADYVAAQVAGLTRWDAALQTGNVRVGIRDHTMTGTQAVVRRDSGLPRPPVTGMRAVRMTVSVYGVDETVEAIAELIQTLFESVKSWTGTNFRFASVLAQESQPLDRSFLEGDTVRFDVIVQCQYHKP